MKLQYLKEDALYTLKHNSETMVNHLHNATNGWIFNVLEEECLGESKIECPPIDFYKDCQNPIESDFENAKRVYSALKKLNETQASDERLWAGIALTIGYEYLIYRWGKDNPKSIIYRWTFYTTTKRGMFYHGIARLWWYTHLTYDHNASDPFHLTEFAFSSPYIMEKMIYRNFSNSRLIRFSILKAMRTFTKEHGTITTDIIARVYKKVSILGGCTILDAYSDSELQQIVYAFIENAHLSKVRGDSDD